MAGSTSSSVEDASTIREMIRHEDELLNGRMTWFCTIQGLLWASLALAWQPEDAWPLACILAALGILVSISSYLAFRASLYAIVRQRDWWDANKPPEYAGPDVLGRRPDRRSVPWMRPHVVFPIGFAAAWLLVAGLTIARACGLTSA